MMASLDVLKTGCEHAQAYRQSVHERACRSDAGYAEMLALFGEPLPQIGTPGQAVIEELVRKGEAGLNHMVHPHFFGWVIGGSDPVGVAADWLVSAWGQNAAFHGSSPTSAAIEEVAGRWLLDVLDLPKGASVGFVTGATVASFTCLAAARGEVLRQHGWDAEADGLFGAPEITVFLGEDAHTSIFAALGYLGLGRNRVRRVKTDVQGRMIAGDLERQISALNGPKIIIGQAGQINTGAFDPFSDILRIARQNGAWVHVDGAFGLWARAHPRYRQLTEAVEQADSWAVDGHKWLQTPFDSGYAIVRDPKALGQAMRIDASYLPTQTGGERDPSAFVPELSRRARGIPTWAMLKFLGRDGVEAMVDHHCRLAAAIATRLAEEHGIRVVNEVQLNQIIVEFGQDSDTPETRQKLTEAVIAHIRDSGCIFVGGARWKRAWVMRISVICGATGFDQVETVADAITTAWREVIAAAPDNGRLS